MLSSWIPLRPLIGLVLGAYAIWIRASALEVPFDAVGIFGGRIVDAALAGASCVASLVATILGRRFPRMAAALMLPVIAFVGASVATGLLLLVSRNPFATSQRFPGFAVAAYMAAPPVSLIVAGLGAALAVGLARRR